MDVFIYKITIMCLRILCVVQQSAQGCATFFLLFFLNLNCFALFFSFFFFNFFIFFIFFFLLTFFFYFFFACVDLRLSLKWQSDLFSYGFFFPSFFFGCRCIRLASSSTRLVPQLGLKITRHSNVQQQQYQQQQEEE